MHEVRHEDVIKRRKICIYRTIFILQCSVSHCFKYFIILCYELYHLCMCQKYGKFMHFSRTTREKYFLIRKNCTNNGLDIEDNKVNDALE